MKKWIKLHERIDVGGEVRRPEEGVIAVASADAAALIKAGRAKAASAPDSDGKRSDGPARGAKKAVSARSRPSKAVATTQAAPVPSGPQEAPAASVGGE